MRILVVSDIHSNLTALEAVLQEAAGSFDQIWSLGDVVGYGPWPNECISLLSQYEHVAIPGNHDYAVLGRISLEDFNREARNANLWTRQQLSDSSRRYLEQLPETITVEAFTLAHGSPRSPIWEYLFYATSARASFEHFDTPVCLVGHTHVPIIFAETADAAQVLPPQEGATVVLDEGRYIINPGSVGQPRDGDPRAAFMLLDLDQRSFTHRRVAYDIAVTQGQMRQLGFSPRLIARLDFGW